MDNQKKDEILARLEEDFATKYTRITDLSCGDDNQLYILRLAVPPQYFKITERESRDEVNWMQLMLAKALARMFLSEFEEGGVADRIFKELQTSENGEKRDDEIQTADG